MKNDLKSGAVLLVVEIIFRKMVDIRYVMRSKSQYRQKEALAQREKN
jgi:hypothetical protein